ncbi:MAG: AIR synthase family protein [Thermoflavifilum sp.]|nr:AIR synthase family protein [Thermoflavifilum sp.]
MENKTGKIDKGFFKSYIEDKCGKQRAEVITKPNFGVDVAVIHISNQQALAIASDPLSLILPLGLEKSAWLSVHLTANDIATTGFPPLYGQFVLNLPASFSENDFQTYWNYIHQYCLEIGLAITGGHTCYVEGQNATIVGGATLFTIAPQDQLLTSNRAQPGDIILVTKSCAISSSAILALSFPETVKNKAGIENYQKACASFYDISVLKDALVATSEENRRYITAMHDVTEGGVLGAIYELAVASNAGAWVYDEQIPINHVQASICRIFSLDPRYCIGAGAMIITCKAKGVQKIKTVLQNVGISCSEVGEITEKEKGIKLVKDDRIENILYAEKDPYWDAYFQAVKLGWK